MADVLIALDPDTDRIRLHREKQKLVHQATRRRKNQALLAVAGLSGLTCGVFLFMQSSAAIPIWEAAFQSALIQENKASRDQVDTMLERLYRQSGQIDKERTLYLTRLSRALAATTTPINTERVRELASKLYTLTPPPPPFARVAHRHFTGRAEGRNQIPQPGRRFDRDWCHFQVQALRKIDSQRPYGNISRIPIAHSTRAGGDSQIHHVPD